MNAEIKPIGCEEEEYEEEILEGMGLILDEEADMVRFPKDLAGKVRAIMADSGYIQKAGRNTIQKYKYVSEEQLVDRLRKLMVKHGVLMIPSVKEIDTQTIDRGGGKPPFIYVTVVLDYLMVDADTGAGVRIGVAGTGIDTQDKALYKAMTGANKYALMKAFQIPSGDDPEDDSWQGEGGEQAPPAATTQPKAKPTGKLDSRTKAFYSKIDELMAAAKEVSDTKVVDATFQKVLGAAGFERAAEITNGKHRLLFVTELEEALNALSEE